MNAVEQLDILIKAAYPIIYIVSFEEARVREQLKHLAKTRSRLITTWSCTQGLIHFDEQDRIMKDEGTEDPLAMLQTIDEKLVPGPNTSKGTLWILCDLHPYLDDPFIIRKLREIADKIKTIRGKTLVILAPVLKLPTELEKQITVLDWPLPVQEDIEQMITNAIADMEQRGIKLTIDKSEREKIVKSCSGLTSEEVENVLSKSLTQTKTIDVKAIIEEKKQIIRKEGVLEYFDVIEDFDNIGGMDNLKVWLMKRGKAFSDEAKEYGLSFPKGVLLLGVQGCGKSLICKAAASLWKLPLIKLDLGKIFEGVVGGSEAKINRAIIFIEKIAPCILMIDELDKGFSGMGSSNMSDAGTTARVIGTFLSWMNDKTSPVFIVATANAIDTLPPELLRKGRFDDIFFVDLPCVKEKEEIFTIHLKKRKRDPSKFRVDVLAELAGDFSGAEIEAAIEEGMFTAFDSNEEVTTDHILDAINETVPLAQTMNDKIDALRKWASTRARPASKKDNGYSVTTITAKRALEIN